MTGTKRPRGRRALLRGIGLALLALVAPGSATAATEVAPPSVIDTKLNDAAGLAAGPDGAMWLVDRDTSNDPEYGGGHQLIARVAMDGSVRRWPLPSFGGFSEQPGLVPLLDGSLGLVSEIARDEQQAPIFAFVRVRAGRGPVSSVLPYATKGAQTLAIAADGTVWFARSCDDVLGRVRPGGETERFRLARVGCRHVDDWVDPWRSAVVRQGLDGRTWLVNLCQGRVARVDLHDRVREWRLAPACTEDPVSARVLPSAVAFAQDGSLLLPGARITARGTLVRERGAEVPDVVTPDGTRWFGARWDEQLRLQTVVGGRRTATAASDGPLLSAAAGPDGLLWHVRAIVTFAQPSVSGFTQPVLAAVDASGAVRRQIAVQGRIPGISLTAAPSLTAGPDGAVWTTMQSDYRRSSQLLRVPTGVAAGSPPQARVRRLLARDRGRVWLQLDCAARPGQFCTGGVELAGRRGRLAARVPFALEAGTRQALQLRLGRRAQRALRGGSLAATARISGSAPTSVKVEVPR